MVITAETAKKDIDKACSHECSVTWHNTATNKKGRCSKPNYKKCYTNDNLDEPIYEYINWKKLKTEFKNFLVNWLKTSETKTLLTELFSLLVANNKTISKTPTYIISDLVTEGQCNDFNFKIEAEIKDDETLRLFHIAFHSKEPKYQKHSDTIFSCGYYENPESKTGKGTFHYKIDSGKKLLADGTEYKTLFKDIEFKKQEQQPYKRITFYIPKSIPTVYKAELWTKNNDKDFENKDYMITDPAKRDLIIEKHKLIYAHFITSWNADGAFRKSILCKPPAKKGGKQIRIQQRYITRKISKKIGKKIGKKKYTKRK